jgi:prepilin-type processing-associated H-X9-DG protein
MDENLVGYLLQSLDPETQAQVEGYLHTHPEARARLERLRRALDPLAADGDDVAVPPGLWVRTLAHIAQDRCRKPRTLPFPGSYRDLPAAPRPAWSQWLGSGGSWWRRADAIVAAVLLLAATSLVVTWLAQGKINEQRLACQNNLRQFYQSLRAYSDHHDNRFPLVEAHPPRNVAGIFVPILNDAGLLSPAVSVSCGTPPVPVRAPSLEELEEMRRDRPEEFDSLIHNLAGCYAYTLGYGTTPAFHSGLRSDEGERLPLMADRPEFRDGRVLPRNSPNHGGNGQNVLFVDGSVEFATVRNVGVNRDDIFVNQRGEVAAGRNRFDSVLGASWARPYPHDE